MYLYMHTETKNYIIMTSMDKINNALKSLNAAILL